MKIKIANEPNEPMYRSQYVLTADGYYGDMDATFRVEESISTNLVQEDIEYLLDGYDLMKQLHDDPQLQYDEQFGRDHPGHELVPTGEGGLYLPTIESFELTWYNEDGVPFNVEVIDE